ncbi:MAG TPA: alanine dehydrogenase [Dehalococcoidia bacterium]|nr:alanine dehydrogenase [Dehalococcoidia bacterium]
MRVGTITETKNEEFRVGLTPKGVKALTAEGHEVFVQSGAGVGSGFADPAYIAAGAQIADTAADVAAMVDLLVKVKEILEPEFTLLRPGLILFAYLHLAPLPGLVDALLRSRTNSIAYELVRKPDGSRPLLAPMSQVAGRMAGEVAAQHLKKPGPGRGKLLGGIEGISPARAVVVGSGNVGTAATEVLLALGAEVLVTSQDEKRLARLKERYKGSITMAVTTPQLLAKSLRGADVLIGAVLSGAGIAPKLVTRGMVRSMGPGGVIVDVCIDQGGICETSRPTTHDNPVYTEESVLHYCVPNMPGAVPQTSTEALTNATLPYVLGIANRGLDLLDDSGLAEGACTINGFLVDGPIATEQGRGYTPLTEALG